MDTLLLIAKVKHGGNPLIFSLPVQRQNRMISAIQRIYGSVRGKTRMHTHFTKLFDSCPNVIGQCSLLIAHSGILPVKRRSMKISAVICLVAIIAITPAVKLTDFVAGAQYRRHDTRMGQLRVPDPSREAVPRDSSTPSASSLQNAVKHPDRHTAP